MVKIKGVNAKTILNSRHEKTILVSVKTNVGGFSASVPSGKSCGKHEVQPYRKNVSNDIKTLKKFSEYFSSEEIDKFDDLRRIEDILDRNVGGNTILATEYAILKALSKEQKKEVWQLINSKAKKLPCLVGNCMEGGKHSDFLKKPDFQEFLLIPKFKSVKKSFEKNIQIKKNVKKILEKRDREFTGKKSDENAWQTSLDNKEVLEILKETKIHFGIDAAPSGFFKRKKYNYKNPPLKRTAQEQFAYLINLIKNFGIYYVEDPFEEEDFEGFAKLLKKFPDRLIVGDDLTVTNYKRLKRAVEKKSINAIIIKPNQVGSLTEVKMVCKLAKKNNIKLVFSHRSGETEEDILADLAFGFGADFFKCGIDGKERESKLRRLIEIEKRLR